MYDVGLWRPTNVNKLAVSIAVYGVVILLAMSSSSLPAVAQNTSTFQPIKRFSVEALVMSPKNVERVDHVDPIDRAFKASQWYLRGATVVDMSTTVIGMEYAHGVETGWGRCFGPHNTSAVVAWNVGLNLGTEFLSRKIYQRGGKWKYVATGLNVLKGTGNLAAGFHNASYIERH